MTKDNYKNEHLKLAFGEYLSAGENKFTDASIVTYMRAIREWQRFSNNESFLDFKKGDAVAFRKWLKTRKSKNEKNLSLRTQDNYIRRVRKFFEWLANEPGKKIPRNDITYLTLSSVEQKEARNQPKKIPTLGEIKKLFHGIDDADLIGKRDKALISLAITTGARVGALTSLQIKSFHPEKLTIYQSPNEGVNTKGSKYIVTTFLPIKWIEPQEYFINWHKKLIEVGYRENDPLFPANLKTKVDGRFQYSNSELSLDFLKGSSSFTKILKKRCLEAEVNYYNPHSFRDFFVSMIMKRQLSPAQMKALSVNFGHENIRTTLESYGDFRVMKSETAVDIIREMSKTDKSDLSISDEDLGRAIKKVINSDK